MNSELNTKFIKNFEFLYIFFRFVYFILFIREHRELSHFVHS